MSKNFVVLLFVGIESVTEIVEHYIKKGGTGLTSTTRWVVDC